MSLFGALTSASRALEAQQYGLDVTGQNIANLNTPGYSRREPLLAAVAPPDRLSAGGGVEVQGLTAVRDRLIERRLLQERPGQQYQSALAETLSLVESAMGTGGSAIDAQLTAYFDSFARLAEDPVSATARQDVVLQGQSLAASFRDLSSRLKLAAGDANARIGAGVDEINAIVSRVATLNEAISRAASSTGEVATLRDAQSLEVQKLSGLIGVSVLERPDGGVDVSLASGQALVIGTSNYQMSTVATPPSGHFDVRLEGQSVTAGLTTGSLGGLLHARDVDIPDYLNNLDTIAYTLVQEVNTLHDAGFDRNGNDAPVFFNALGGVAGAASAIGVNAAVVADPNLVGAAAVAAAGDNGQARALAALADKRVLSGNTATLHDAWGTLLYKVGADAQTAAFEEGTRSDVLRQVENMRDAVSGVSLDEEATRMLKFQRAYEANARFFTTIDETIQVLLSLKR